jgi:hypothetical protein
MKTFEQTGDVIAFIADFHRELRQRYKKMTGVSERKRVQLLLDFLSRHEKRWLKGLEQYGLQYRKKLQDTWHQYIPETDKLDIEDLRLKEDMSVDELVKTALECDNRLIEFFTRMSESAGVPEQTRELFRRMIEQEEGEKARLVQTAEQIKHL